MPLFQDNLDDEVLVDDSVPLSGVNNSLPPSVIDKQVAADAQNRLSQLDGLNRPRPGIIRLAQDAGAALDSVHHIGSGVFLANNAGSWHSWNNRTSVWTVLSGGPAYAAGAQVYSGLANTVLYFSIGSTLNKY